MVLATERGDNGPENRGFFSDRNKFHVARVHLDQSNHGPKEVRMQIQVNHDNHVRLVEDTAERLSKAVEDSLAKFADRITRVEMHLGDINAGKGGADKRCVLEARIANLQPIAVTHQAETLQLAIDGALDKLDHALSHAIGKLETH
jgi:ribosome-associated translation inhibitor RaiA